MHPIILMLLPILAVFAAKAMYVAYYFRIHTEATTPPMIVERGGNILAAVGVVITAAVIIGSHPIGVFLFLLLAIWVVNEVASRSGFANYTRVFLSGLTLVEILTTHPF